MTPADIVEVRKEALCLLQTMIGLCLVKDATMARLALRGAWEELYKARQIILSAGPPKRPWGDTPWHVEGCECFYCRRDKNGRPSDGS